MEFPKEAYAYAPSGDPEKWRLCLWETPESGLTLREVKRAAAALSPGGLEGKRTTVPEGDLPSVKARIRMAYKALNVPDIEISRWVKEEAERRVLATGFVKLHESAASLLAENKAEVVVIESGFNSSGEFYYPPEMLSRDYSVFEGLKMYADHQTEQEEAEKPEGAIRNWVATVKDVHFDESSQSVKGTAYIVESWFAEKLANLREQNLLETMGVSIRAIGIGTPGKVEESDTIVIESFLYGRSVDFVTEAGAGGKVLAIHESEARNIDIDLIDVETLRAKRPDLVESIRENEREVIKQMDEKEKEIQGLQESNQVLQAENESLKAEAEEKAKQTAMLEAQSTIKEAVAGSELPDMAKERLLRDWKESATAEGIQEAIQAEAEYIASLPGANAEVKDMGESRQETEEVTESELTEAFKRLGLSDGEAAIAARKR